MSDSSTTPCTLVRQAPLSTGFPRQKYWRSGLTFPSPRIFPTHGSNLHLLNWQADSLPLSHQGSPTWLLHDPEFSLALLQQWGPKVIHTISIVKEQEQSLKESYKLHPHDYLLFSSDLYFNHHPSKTPKQPWHTSDSSGVLWLFTLRSSNPGFSSASVISLGLTLGEDSLSSQQGSIN